MNALTQETIFWTLQVVFRDHMHASNAIQKTLQKQKNWNTTQKEFFSDIVYDLIRHWRLLWYVVGREPSFEEKYFHDFLQAYTVYKGDGFFHGKKTPLEKIKRMQQRIQTATSIRMLRESLPDWLDTRGEEELGNRWDSIVTALNQQPDLMLRVNTIKTTRDDLLKTLKQEGVDAELVEQCVDAVHAKKKTNVFRLKSFHDGLFEVQDCASQMASRFLQVEPRMLVVDACAGEGSKTLHLAALMHNKGRILALDTAAWKLQELRRRAKRAGADTIETRVVDSSKVYKRLRDTVDRVLLDVPCSGLGTLRRNPDIKWSLSLNDLQRLLVLQRDLLNTYSPLVKKGGKLVYATCSVLPSEGEKQIQDFLKNNQDVFHLVEEKRYWPDTDKTDGFYMALLERKT